MKFHKILAIAAVAAALVFAAGCGSDDDNGNSYGNGDAIGTYEPTTQPNDNDIAPTEAPGEITDLAVPAETLQPEVPAAAGALSGTFVSEDGEPGSITFTGNTFVLSAPIDEFDPNATDSVELFGTFTVNETAQTINLYFDEDSVINAIRTFARFYALSDPFFAADPMLADMIDPLLEAIFDENIDIELLFNSLILDIAQVYFPIAFAEFPALIDFGMAFIDSLFGTGDIDAAITLLLDSLIDMMGLGGLFSDTELAMLLDEILDEILDDMDLMLYDMYAELEDLFYELSFMIDDIMFEMSYLFEELTDVVFTFTGNFDRLYDPDGYAMVRR